MSVLCKQNTIRMLKYINNFPKKIQMENIPLDGYIFF